MDTAFGGHNSTLNTGAWSLLAETGHRGVLVADKAVAPATGELSGHVLPRHTRQGWGEARLSQASSEQTTPKALVGHCPGLCPGLNLSQPRSVTTIAGAHGAICTVSSHTSRQVSMPSCLHCFPSFSLQRTASCRLERAPEVATERKAVQGTRPLALKPCFSRSRRYTNMGASPGEGVHETHLR